MVTNKELENNIKNFEFTCHNYKGLGRLCDKCLLEVNIIKKWLADRIYLELQLKRNLPKATINTYSEEVIKIWNIIDSIFEKEVNDNAIQS